MLHFIYHRLGRIPTATLVVPDFEALFYGDDQATIIFCRLAMWVCLQSSKRQEFVSRTLQLPDEYQENVMRVVKLVRARFT